MWHRSPGYVHPGSKFWIQPCYTFPTVQEKLNTNIHRPQQSWSITDHYLKDDENIDPSQDHSSNGHLCLHTDEEWLVSHGQRHHFIILQEGLNRDDDGVTAQGSKQQEGNQMWIFVLADA